VRSRNECADVLAQFADECLDQTVVDHETEALFVVQITAHSTKKDVVQVAELCAAEQVQHVRKVVVFLDANAVDALTAEALNCCDKCSRFWNNIINLLYFLAFDHLPVLELVFLSSSKMTEMAPTLPRSGLTASTLAKWQMQERASSDRGPLLASLTKFSKPWPELEDIT
jgi:hypothetical protein